MGLSIDLRWICHPIWSADNTAKKMVLYDLYTLVGMNAPSKLGGEFLKPSTAETQSEPKTTFSVMGLILLMQATCAMPAREPTTTIVTRMKLINTARRIPS